MIEATSFLDAAAAIGIGFYTGVPCSFLTPLINRTASDRTLRYAGAASRAGAGAVSPLTSLNAPFRIPTLLIVTWRGQPGLSDEPQHELMGRITQNLLDVIEVPHRRFPTELDALGSVMEEARTTMARTSLPFALVIEKDTLRDEL